MNGRERPSRSVARSRARDSATPPSPVFLTRKYPPSVGGMETLAAGVWRSIEAVRPDAVLIAHGGDNRMLPVWLPRAFFRLSTLMFRGRVESVLTGDALMNALVAPLTWLFRTPRVTMVMGLDVTFDNRIYRAVVHPVLRRTDKVIAISAATADAARQFGVPADRIDVVRLGVAEPEPGSRSIAAAAVRQLAGIDDSATVLLTLGRLVRRKGVRWFVDDVMPRLPKSIHYLIAGDGPDEDAIRSAVQRQGLSGRVHLLGAVDDARREQLLRGADIFIQPNIAVPGDMEGFGLVTVEAALRGTTTVAADLEGIKDAVVDGDTGILLPSMNADIWAERIVELAGDRERLNRLGVTFAGAAATMYGEKAMGEELRCALGWAAARLG